MRRRSLANVVLYPMSCMRVSDFRKLRKGDHLPHQLLKAKGLLSEWHEDMGPVAFVSHQWLAWEHADPDFEQLAVLQRVVERIANGELDRIGYSFEHEFIEWNTDEMKPIEQPELLDWVKNGYIWFDYVGFDHSKELREGAGRGGAPPRCSAGCRVQSMGHSQRPRLHALTRRCAPPSRRARSSSASRKS